MGISPVESIERDIYFRWKEQGQNIGGIALWYPGLFESEIADIIAWRAEKDGLAIGEDGRPTPKPAAGSL